MSECAVILDLVAAFGPPHHNALRKHSIPRPAVWCWRYLEKVRVACREGTCGERSAIDRYDGVAVL